MKKTKGHVYINKYHNLLLQGCLSQDVEMVKKECKKPKLELEIADEYGNTPLIVASGSGNLEIVKILITKLKSLHFGIFDFLTSPYFTTSHIPIYFDTFRELGCTT